MTATWKNLMRQTTVTTEKKITLIFILNMNLQPVKPITLNFMTTKENTTTPYIYLHLVLSTQAVHRLVRVISVRFVVNGTVKQVSTQMKTKMVYVISVMPFSAMKSKPATPILSQWKSM